MPAQTPPPIEIRIEDRKLVLEASVRELDDVYRRYMSMRASKWTPEERQRMYNSLLRHETSRLELYTTDDGWPAVLYALRGKNLIIRGGWDKLDKFFWEDELR